MTEATKPTETATVVQMPKARQKFAANSLAARGVKTQDYDMILPAGTKLEDLLDPHLWVHLAHQLRVDDTIAARTESRDLWAHLWVVGITNRVVAVRVLHAKTFAVAASPTMGQTTGAALPRVEFRGRQKQWCVIGLDGEIVEGMMGFNSEEQATPSLISYRQTLALIAK